MDALIDAVAEKTGLDRSMIATAAPAVVEFLADRLPDPVGGMLTRLAEGGDVDTDDLLGIGAAAGSAARSPAVPSGAGPVGDGVRTLDGGRSAGR